MTTKFLRLLTHLLLLDRMKLIDSEETVDQDRKPKNNLGSYPLPLTPLQVFQVVKFPNTPCFGEFDSKNGTCYTAEECNDRGGSNFGTCAQGFGICCGFTMGCGSMTSENCTYFDHTLGANSADASECVGQVCKCSPNVCQLRLDFETFVINGPTTASTSVFHILGGQVIGRANGVAVSIGTQCLTDTFQISNQANLPLICGTMTGEHVYVDFNANCLNLSFQFGRVGRGVTIVERSISIKASQYNCDYFNMAPSGCDQYFYSSTGTGYVQSFNYAGSKHLADQSQTICIRRELNKCRICWSADAKTDIQLSLDTNKSSGIVTGTICCGYSMSGKGIDNMGAYDCLMIPGAITTKSALNPESMCGGKAGLVTKKGDNGSKTICSKAMPFRIEFHTDSYEMSAAAMDEGTGANTGFKLRYFQTDC